MYSVQSVEKDIPRLLTNFYDSWCVDQGETVFLIFGKMVRIRAALPQINSWMKYHPTLISEINNRLWIWNRTPERNKVHLQWGIFLGEWRRYLKLEVRGDDEGRKILRQLHAEREELIRVVDEYFSDPDPLDYLKVMFN